MMQQRATAFICSLIGVMRHDWTAAFAFASGGTDEDGSNFQGRWTHQFKIGLRRSGLADSRRNRCEPT